MQASKKKNTKLLLTIFITVFIDLLGITIIIPVVPAIFYEEGSSFFTDTSFTNQQISYLYGLLLACYPLMQFFGAPILGSLSDRHGRKPVLSIALIGTMIGYMLFAYAILSKNLWLLFFSRMLPGFTGGNISIIMSSIADISDKESKTRNFGLVGMAFGMGFILGPMIGGFLSDDTILPWFNHSVPFVFTAILTFINILLVRLSFKETLKKPIDSSVSIFKGVQNIFTSFRTPHLRAIFTIVLLLAIGFTFYTQFFSVLLYEKFDFKEKDIGLLYGYIGIWLALTQGILVRYLSYKIPPKKILIISIPFLAFGIFLVLVPTEGWMFYLVNPIIAIFYGVTSPNMTTLVSAQADESTQGSMLGINQSMASLGAAITPAIGGYLGGMDPHYPIIAGTIVISLAFIIFAFTKDKIRY